MDEPPAQRHAERQTALHRKKLAFTSKNNISAGNLT
jgi:hypothetical protein